MYGIPQHRIGKESDMQKILDCISAEMQGAFEKAGYDGALGRVTVSNRPDLCEYQCNGAMAGAAGGVIGGGLQLVLNITNFNNYSNEDIQQLTNEVLVTAGQFAKRKGVVFA